MVLRSTETLQQRGMVNATASSKTGRAELLSAIDDLVAKVEKLAIQVNGVVALVDAGKLTCSSEGPDRLSAAAGTAVASDLQAGDTGEVTSIPLSPHQSGWICNADPIDKVSEVNSIIETSQFAPKGGSSKEMYAIAGRVLELHDRLGGFIKPSPPSTSKQEN
jgi:hypothetical protein